MEMAIALTINELMTITMFMGGTSVFLLKGEQIRQWSKHLMMNVEIVRELREILSLRNDLASLSVGVTLSNETKHKK